ncbi:uncharacterized protein [Lepisosteus oculatus]|uniref:uncharacterized protein isoform X1 n=1 Tax=Lepisosteus oculatus TaxID=7918 RepID=UPI0035F524F0
MTGGRRRAAASLLLLVIRAAVQERVSGGPEVRAAICGETVTLPCVVGQQYEVMWFVQRSDGALALSVLGNANTASGQTDPFTYVRRPDSRFSLVLNSSTDSPDLRIEGVTETDQGLYYCATRDRGEIHIGKGTRLELVAGGEEPNCTSQSPPPCGDPGVPPGGALALSALLTAILTAILTAGFLRCCPACRKGPPEPEPGAGDPRKAGNKGGCAELESVAVVARRPPSPEDVSAYEQIWPGLGEVTETRRDRERDTGPGPRPLPCSCS